MLKYLLLVELNKILSELEMGYIKMHFEINV